MLPIAGFALICVREIGVGYVDVGHQNKHLVVAFKFEAFRLNTNCYRHRIYGVIRNASQTCARRSSLYCYRQRPPDPPYT